MYPSFPSVADVMAESTAGSVAKGGGPISNNGQMQNGDVKDLRAKAKAWERGEGRGAGFEVRRR